MKTILYISFTILLLATGCKNNDTQQVAGSSNSDITVDANEKATEVTLPPPVEKADDETVRAKKFETPKVVENEVADMQEPTGNSNIDRVQMDEPVAGTEKKIIKDGNIRFESRNVAETRRQLLSTLKRFDGYVDNDSETTNGYEGSKEYNLSIRIPAKNFDAFLESAVVTATKIDSRNIRVKDVISEFIDIKTRLDNKKILEGRYLKLLNKATKITDLLSIEDKLTEIRSDIESTQNQLTYMNKQVAYSTLSVTFYTKQPGQVAAGNGFGYKLIHAIGNGFSTLQELLFVLITLWPLWIAGGIAVFMIKRWRRNRSKQLPAEQA